MKRLSIILITVLVLLVHCDKSSTKSENDKDKSVQFLAFYEPGEEQLLGENKQIAQLSIANNECNYSSFLNIYPYRNNFLTNSANNSSILAMGLHSDFNDDRSTRGVAVNISDKSQDYLPLVQPSEDSDYPYFLSQSVRVSDNGMVLYMTATNDKSYGDEYRPFLIRYNPETKEHQVAASPESFVLNQPEKGDDTETGQIDRAIAISPDGRYAYGVIEAYGVSGNIHWDYEILFQYDFETEQYKRLGDEDDSDASFIALTRDGKYIIYSNRSERKIYNLQTETTTVVSISGYGPIPIQMNNYGFCDNSTTGIYYYNYVQNETVKVIHSYYTSNAQFSEDQESIYFTIRGSEENYLCKSIDLLEDTEWDTLAAIPKEFSDIKLLK
ncbi:MAG: hypothetical protein ACLFQM_02750 [Fidelibacterota bacterium]